MDDSSKLVNAVLQDACKFLTSEQLLSLQCVFAAKVKEFTIREMPSDMIVYGQQPWQGALTFFVGMKLMSGTKKSSMEQYQYLLRRTFEHLDKPISEVTTLDLIECMQWFRNTSKRGLSPAYMENIRLTWSLFFAFCKSKGMIPNSPCDGIDPIKYKKKPVITFDDEELEKVRIACEDERESAMVEFLYSTGLRVCGAISVKLEDIDWRTGILRVKEKGDKERVVVLNGRAQARLKEYIKTRPKSLQNSGPLFISNRRPYKGLSDSGFRSAVEAIAKRAEVGKKGNPHMFRRKFATDALRRGCPINDLAEMLGHSNYNTTRMYLQIDQERQISTFKTYAI